METGLAVISSINAIEFFQPGAALPILERLKSEVREQASKLDISTKEGRDAIASLAYKVSRSKTALDDAGKELVEDQKRALSLIDKERKIVRDEMDALRDEVRAPLTEWETADKKRVAALEYKVITMQELAAIAYNASVDDIQSRIESVDALAASMTDMQEFTSRAALAEKTTRDHLNHALTEARARAEQAAELARLQAEAAERAKKEHEARIAQEAREKAQREAEAERVRIEQEKYEAEARAMQAEAEKKAVEERAIREAEAAEQRRIEAEAKAKQDAEEASARHAAELKAQEERRQREAKEAEERAERDRLAAIETERQRVAAEEHKAQEEAERRERNRKHVAGINNTAALSLVAHVIGLTDEQAKLVVTAIAKGQIPAVKIAY